MSTDTGDLITWFRERLAEDQDIAESAELWTSLSNKQWPFRIDDIDDGPWAAADAWRDRFHPKRMLAEVAAKRRILATYEASRRAVDQAYEAMQAAGKGNDPASPQWHAWAVAESTMSELWWVVHDLAQPLAGHPGWRDEWKVTE